MRRDVGNELIVAISAVAVLALAVIFGIILTLSNTGTGGGTVLVPTNTPADLAALPTDIEASTQEVPDSATEVSVDQEDTLAPTPEADVPSETPVVIVPTDTEAAALTEVAVLSTEAVTETFTPSATETEAPTEIPTDTPSPTATVDFSETLEALSLSATAIAETRNTPRASVTEDATTAALNVEQSDTPTDEPTERPTRTAAPTDTPLPTETATDTATPTDEPTATDTATRTPRPTETDTPEPTNTRRPTNSRTPQPTDTERPTRTPRPTLTATFTETATHTATFTPTDEPTATDTPRPTVTNTSSPTDTSTRTFTASPTNTDTATATRPPTRTPRPTATRALPTAIVLGGTPALPTPLVIGTEVSRGDCEFPEDWSIYFVQPSDTLYRIGQAVFRSVGELRDANCLRDVDSLYTGMTLYVPFVPAIVPPAPVESIATPDAPLTAEGCTDLRARIDLPQVGAEVPEVFTVFGTALVEDFNYYQIEIRPDSAELYMFYDQVETAVASAALAQVNTSYFDDGLHWLRLTVVSNSGSFPETCALPLIFR